MKTMMSCDDAFASLTAGPIEMSSPNSQELMDHLATCASCRELAEALRPAVHLLHEVLPRRQREGLPLVLAREDAVVASVMEQVGRVSPPAGRSVPRSLAAAGLATVACVLLVLLAPWWSAATGVPPQVHQQLSDLGLPAACWQPAQATAAHRQRTSSECNQCHSNAMAQERSCSLTLTCCTHCHAAPSSPAVIAHRVDMTRLVAACVTCHTPSY